MRFRVNVDEKTYEVDERDDHTITIDGQPLTRLSSEPEVRARYALETEILAKDWAARTRAQAAFSAMLRGQVSGR